MSVSTFVEVRGKSIEVRRFPEEPAPPAAGVPTLVFLHEGLGSVGLWRDFPARAAQATGLPAFVYSRAGYGRSSAPPLPRSLQYMHEEARLLPEILGKAGIVGPIVFGHSDGASIALLHAAEDLRVRGLLLEAPHVFTEDTSLRSIARARDAYLFGELKPRLARWHEHVDAAFWGWNASWLHPDFRQWNLESALPAIRVPMLLLQGADDEYGSERQLRAIERGAAGPVETRVLDRCGHAPHQDQPDATLEALRALVARLPA